MKWRNIYIPVLLLVLVAGCAGVQPVTQPEAVQQPDTQQTETQSQEQQAEFFISARDTSGCPAIQEDEGWSYDCSSEERVKVPLGTFLKKIAEVNDVFIVENFEGQFLALGWWGTGLASQVLITLEYGVSLLKEIPTVITRDGDRTDTVRIETVEGTLIKTLTLEEGWVTLQVTNSQGQQREIRAKLIFVHEKQARFDVGMAW